MERISVIPVVRGLRLEDCEFKLGLCKETPEKVDRKVEVNWGGHNQVSLYSSCTHEAETGETQLRPGWGTCC